MDKIMKSKVVVNGNAPHVNRYVYALPGLGKSTVVKSSSILVDFDELADEQFGGHRRAIVIEKLATLEQRKSFVRSSDLTIVGPMHFERSVAETLAFVVPPSIYVTRLKDISGTRSDLLENFSEKELFSWANDAWRYSLNCRGRVVLGRDEFVGNYQELIEMWAQGDYRNGKS